MKLSFGTARCNGHWNLLPFGRQLDTVCIDCVIRSSASLTEQTSWVLGTVVDGVCNSKIEDVE